MEGPVTHTHTHEELSSHAFQRSLGATKNDHTEEIAYGSGLVVMIVLIMVVVMVCCTYGCDGAVHGGELGWLY